MGRNYNAVITIDSKNTTLPFNDPDKCTFLYIFMYLKFDPKIIVKVVEFKDTNNWIGYTLKQSFDRMIIFN